MAEGDAPTEPKKVVHIYPLVKESDMSEDMKNEAIELIVTACEKYATNNELAANLIKEQMDKKFGPSWHVLVGEGFGFDISYEVLTKREAYIKGQKLTTNHIRCL